MGLIDTNLYGPKRMFDAFHGLLSSDGRVVNVGSGSGPSFVSRASAELKAVLTDRDVTWEQIEALITKQPAIGRDAYGFSKACLTAYTMALANHQRKAPLASSTAYSPPLQPGGTGGATLSAPPSTSCGIQESPNTRTHRRHSLGLASRDLRRGPRRLSRIEL